MDQKRFQSLKKAVENSRKQLEPFREELEKTLKSYTGPHYGANRDVGDKPINMLELAVTSLLQQLSSRNPQVVCTTHNPNAESAAIEMELAVNHALKKMDFEKEHRLWVLSAIFCVGIMEVGLDVIDSPEIDGEELPITDVFCETIMFDDFVFDTSAAKWGRQQVAFWGHKYKVSLAEAKRNKSFSKEVREKLTAAEKQKDGTGSISTGESGSDEPFTEMCEIWQVFVPETDELVTFSMESDMPLKTVEWKGPKNGPYHFFGFNPVLNNIMGLPPVANWIDLDDLENKLYTKLGIQASRQKTIGITDNSNLQDAQNIIKTNDGDVLAVGNPNNFKEASFGGVNQQTLGFALNVKSMADFVMGNLSAQMGLGASSPTLGQEEMIKQAANVRIASMQGVLLSATEKVIRDIAFYLHHHPTIEYEMTREITGTDLKVPVKWPRRDDGFGNEMDVRNGDYDEYEIKIEPYSMTDISPGQRAQLLRSIWAQDVLPAIQLGVQPDVYAYLDTLAKYLDLPELRKIVKMTQQAMPPQMMGEGGGMGAPKPGKPNGKYTRNNVSHGQTPQAHDQQMAQLMMASGGEGEQ